MASPSFSPRYKKVADFVRNRILHGDYSLKPIPSERQLAEELGANHMTVRRGLGILESEDLIVRHPNGRRKVKRVLEGRKKHLNLAFMMPTLASQALEVWRWAIEKATAQISCTVRPIVYMHWDDPVLTDAIEGFDGVFLSPIPEPLPDVVAVRLRDSKHPVIVIDHDFSAHGIPSIQTFPATFYQKLFDHLDSLGHRSIGCLNTQPHDSEIRIRINQWRFWMAAHGYKGRLEDRSVVLHGNTIDKAYAVMKSLLTTKKSEETAWFCTTCMAAIGVMAAMKDCGVEVGKDLLVCAASTEGLGGMLNPSLTALDTSDPTPFVSLCLEHIMHSPRKWRGPLLMQSQDAPLAIRDSTSPGAGRGPSTSTHPNVNAEKGKKA